jgi:cobalt-precorrin-7 (C5)-methyltransferase
MERMKPSPIVIVGCGPGSADYLTPAALNAVKGAQVILGAQRLLDLFPTARAERIGLNTGVEELLKAMEDRLGRQRMTVLVSGDPGVFSLARFVIRRFGPNLCRVIPGISSVQVAFARLGLNWDDAHIMSAHKGDAAANPCPRGARKIAILGGNRGAMRRIARPFLEGASGSWRIFVFENLALEEEFTLEVAPRELEALDIAPRSVVLIIRGELLP